MKAPAWERTLSWGMRRMRRKFFATAAPSRGPVRSEPILSGPIRSPTAMTTSQPTGSNASTQASTNEGETSGEEPMAIASRA